MATARAGAAPAAAALADAQGRRARRAALGARAAALARRPRERAVAGRDPAAREHRPRALDERVARGDRGARLRPAGRDDRSCPPSSARRCWRPSSGTSRTLAGLAIGLLLLTGVIQGIVEVGHFGALLDTRVRPRGADQGDRRAGDRRARRLQPAAAAPAAAKRLTGSPGHTGVLLRRTLRAELGLGARGDRRHRRALELRALDRRVLRPVLDRRDRRPGAHGGHGRPRPHRPERAAPLPVRPQERRALHRDQAADAHRRAAVQADRQDHAQPARRRARGTTSSTAPTSASRATWTLDATIRVSDFDEFSKEFSGPDRGG